LENDLSPESENSRDEEFVRYDWDDPESVLGVSNSILADFYAKKLRDNQIYNIEYTTEDPISGSDLLARALPFMSFADVFMPGACIFFKDNLQHKNYYNDAIAKQLQRFKYTVSRGEGVDVLVLFGDSSNVKTIAIQSILANCSVHDHNKEARRLVKFNCASTLKTLLVIGRENTVMKRIGELDHYDGIEVVGLMVSEAHETYKMHIKPAPIGSRFGKKPQTNLFVVCDRVAKRIEKDIRTGLLSIKPAQKLRSGQEKERDWLSINEDGNEDKMDIEDEDEGGQQKQEQVRRQQQEQQQEQQQKQQPGVRFVRGRHVVSLFPCEVADCSNGDDLLKKATEQALSFRNNIFVYSTENREAIRLAEKAIIYGFNGLNLASKDFKETSIKSILSGKGESVVIDISLVDVVQETNKSRDMGDFIM